MYESFGINEETTRAICKFTVLWNYFESHIYGKECNPKKIFSGHRVSNLYVTENCTYLIANVKSTVLEYARGAHVLDRLIPKNRIGELNGNRRDIVMTFFQSKNTTVDANTFIAIEYVLYRIRCNLFHGTKSPYFLNDQIHLFNAINEYLDYMVTFFEPYQD